MTAGGYAADKSAEDEDDNAGEDDKKPTINKSN